MLVETTCNSTLERLISMSPLFESITAADFPFPVEPGTEKLLVGPLTFHDLALIVGGSFAIISIFLSLYLAFMHAINYTKPDEQRQYVLALSSRLPVRRTTRLTRPLVSFVSSS